MILYTQKLNGLIQNIGHGGNNMKGRQETDKHIEENIKTILDNSFCILNDYYYFLNDKTMTTKKAYLQHAISFLSYIHYNNDNSILVSLKPSDIGKFLDYIKRKDNGEEKSQSWIANIYYGLSCFMNFLVEEDYIPYNICSKIKAPKNKQEKEMAYLTTKEIEIVKENILNDSRKKWRTRNMAIFLLGCGTGLRASSIREINVEDMDLDKGTIIVTEKGNKTWVCHLPNKVIDSIKAWLVDRNKIENLETSALFISQKKNRISIDGIEDIVTKYTEGLDKHVTAHTMRHTCGTNVYEMSGDLYLTAEILHHRNVQTSKIYAKVSEKKRVEAAQLLNATI